MLPKRHFMSTPTDPIAFLSESISQTEYAFMSADVMALAVRSKLVRRQKKELPYGCRVLKEGELNRFFNYLEGASHYLPNRTRFQVIALSKLAHWVVVDVLIKDKQLEFFIIDPLRDVEAKSHSTREVVFSILTKTSSKSVGFSLTESQVDEKSCAIFALDATARLSKNQDFHDQYKKIISEEKSVDTKTVEMFKRWGAAINAEDYPGLTLDDLTQRVHAVAPSDFPVEWMPLLRNTQSVTRLKNMAAQEKYKAAKGSDTESFEKYTSKRFGEEKIKQKDGAETSELHNLAIAKKLATIKTKASALLKLLNDDERDDIIKNREGYYLSSFAEITKLYDQAIDDYAACIQKLKAKSGSSSASFWFAALEKEDYAKYSAADKMINLLQGQSAGLLSENEISLLRAEELGVITARLETQHILPKEFAIAEQALMQSKSVPKKGAPSAK